ncbi:MAG: iron complex transport system ATP-binding protein [Gammaproteobacteria bacterium]|jgi:iron complex transport system ATP-binding protein
MSLLTTQSLTVSIAGKPICNKLNVTMQRGERWAILGGNGAGKTTLLHTFAGLRTADKGQVYFSDKSLEQWPRKLLSQKLGLLLQDSNDIFPSTVLETVMIGRHPHLKFWEIESQSDFDIARQALVEVSLEDAQDRQVNTLSGGERRRLAIATLLVQNPELFLLDEPTNHLDMRYQITLLEMLIRKAKEQDGCLCMVLHDANLASRYCTHIMLMISPDDIVTGSVDDILNEDNLARLYQFPIKSVETESGRVFLPGAL